MAVELLLEKSSDATPWGFRLVGGADCDVPLTVVKVFEDSIAENAGMQVEDVVVRINDQPMAGLTHSETHEVITNAGLKFIMTVRRGYYDNVQDDEICDIMQQCQKSDQKTESLENNSLFQNSLIEDRITEAILSKAEALQQQNILEINSADLINSDILQEPAENTTDLNTKKWSTFLQKPDRPAVVPKQKDDDIPKAPPYRPVIKRQKKVDEDVSTDASIQFEISEEITHETVVEDNEDVNAEIFQEDNFVQEDVQEEAYIEEVENDETEDVQDEEEDVEEIEQAEEDKPLTLEEQLAQVQQQLLALAQLPSAVQGSLEVVTNQLARIVGIKPEKNYNQEEEFDEDATVSSVTSSDNNFINQIEEDENVNGIDAYDDSLDKFSDESISAIIDNDDENPEEYVQEKSVQEETETKEELEAKRAEEEDKLLHHERPISQIEESHQRRLEQRPTHALTPLQRPIVLPGGRRWAQPDDALPAIRKPKMSDEKISETLDTYSEIIVGHTKGINFLKYQPPAKNMDYLQRSEVFRLIHDNEPPTQGIAARSEIVPSIEDYYNRT